MGKITCKFYEKLSSKKRLSHDEIKILMNIVRKELSFLIKHNIPPVPNNYEKWFYIFCSLIEENKELTDLEIIGLYKEIYEEDYQIVDINGNKEKETEEVSVKLRDIADKIDVTLKELIHNIDDHQANIDNHANSLAEKSNEIQISDISQTIHLILDELKELKSQNEFLKTQIKKYHSEIHQLREELSNAKTEATMDFLTGLVNRRRFERALEDAIKDYETRNYPFSLIYVDIDNFKDINDNFGHNIGDIVLKEIATIFKFYLRANTIIGRIGGEEFAILLPGVEIEDAVKIAERLRNIIYNREIRIGSRKDEILRVTASLGVTQVKKGDTVNSILHRADTAMYRAKKTGKNKVEVEK
ncbi:diguanylate cyclase [Persephonella sp.]